MLRAKLGTLCGHGCGNSVGFFAFGPAECSRKRVPLDGANGGPQTALELPNARAVSFDRVDQGLIRASACLDPLVQAICAISPCNEPAMWAPPDQTPDTNGPSGGKLKLRPSQLRPRCPGELPYRSHRRPVLASLLFASSGPGGRDKRPPPRRR